MPPASPTVRHVVVTAGRGRFWVAYRQDLRDGPISVMPVLLADPGVLFGVARELQAGQIVDQVVRLVESWELMDDHGSIALDRDSVRRVPLDVLQRVLRKIVDDCGAELEALG
jgi:hypothetical protein